MKLFVIIVRVDVSFLFEITIYLNRAMKEHELLQAIARVNRTYLKKTMV